MAGRPFSNRSANWMWSAVSLIFVFAFFAAHLLEMDNDIPEDQIAALLHKYAAPPNESAEEERKRLGRLRKAKSRLRAKLRSGITEHGRNVRNGEAKSNEAEVTTDDATEFASLLDEFSPTPDEFAVDRSRRLREFRMKHAMLRAEYRYRANLHGELGEAMDTDTADCDQDALDIEREEEDNLALLLIRYAPFADDPEESRNGK